MFIVHSVRSKLLMCYIIVSRKFPLTFIPSAQQ